MTTNLACAATRVPEADAIASVSADVSRDEWDTYVGAHPDATVYHQWEWRHVYESAFGHRAEYLAARLASGAVVGVLPLVVFDHPVFGRFMVSLPFVNYGGVLADNQPARDGLLQEANRRATAYGLTHVELRHVSPQFPTLPRRTHKVSMTMGLAQDEETAWNRLDSKVRNHLRKAEKSGLTCETGGNELLPEFYAIFAQNMRDLGTPVYPKRWFAEMLTRFPTQARLTVVRSGRVPVAAALGLGFRDRLEVPSSGSLRAYRSLSANSLLFWQVIRRAITDGYRVLDFGRSSPGDGPFRFKEQWGATAGPMNWEYVLRPGHAMPDRSPKNTRFSLAISAWQRLPLPVANRLGPSIVRFLP